MNAIHRAVLSVVAVGLLSFGAHAEQIPGTQLEVHLERANIGGVGRSVIVRRVPVRNQTTGDTKYYDINFRITSNASGNLAFEAVDQIDVTPRFPSGATLVAGRYTDFEQNVYSLAGPSIDAQGGENYSLELLEAGPQSSLTQLSVNLGGRSFADRFPDTQGQNAGILNAERAGDLTGIYTKVGGGSNNPWRARFGNSTLTTYVTASASSADQVTFTTWSDVGTDPELVPRTTITLTRQAAP